MIFKYFFKNFFYDNSYKKMKENNIFSRIKPIPEKFICFFVKMLNFFILSLRSVGNKKGSKLKCSQFFLNGNGN